MLQRALSVCAVLGLASAAQAGVIVTLVPSTQDFVPGVPFNVDVMAQLDGPVPVTGATSIRLRLAQFDLSDTDPALTVIPVSTHPDAEVPFRFWDFTSTSNCQGDSTACGDRYLIDGELPSPPLPENIFNVAFTGQTQNLPRMLALSTDAATRLGILQVTIPAGAQGGTFLLDVMNSDTTNENLGAEVRYGFAPPPPAPADPAGSFRAAGGGMTGGTLVVPEPTTLAILGLGGLAAAYRRRRAA
jgi:hypothetical protein